LPATETYRKHRLTHIALQDEKHPWLELGHWVEGGSTIRLASGPRRRQSARQSRTVISPAIGSPATWGLFRPVIVLPPAARDWTVERRRVVLAHELAHVARRDGLANLIGWMACALYWPNPLDWIAARRLAGRGAGLGDDRGRQGDGNRGRIRLTRSGERADLVVLDADPAADIANARRVRLVMRNGRLYPQRELVPGR